MPLNEMQQKAVEHTEGPLLVLAGAGSGKTTVLVNRVQHIIKEGLAQPWQVLAITFTNKAAAEIRERLQNIVGEEANSIWAYTFHSCAARILRRFAERLGYTSHFTIYDTDDQKRIMKRCQDRLKISDKYLPAKAILKEISSAKDSLIDPEEYKKETARDFRKKEIGQLYEEYQTELKKCDAMDFDDLIYNTVKLLKKDEEVRTIYQRQFKYVMVDEYQDTSYAQFKMVDLLSGGYGNICVVGDDDQSIYRFRGATVKNILEFENRYPGTTLIRLEQNYRSTQNILDAANAVISNNVYRKGKNLWTEAGEGSKIMIKTVEDETAEADYIAKEIFENVEKGYRFKDIAVLYRTNAQSRNIEIALTKNSISHKIIGGNRFFDRKEIKDITAYLALINNPDDRIRFQRIVNVPKRGIGASTVSAVMEISTALGMSVLEVCERADEFQQTQRARNKLKDFAKLIRDFQQAQDEMPLNDLLQKVLEDTKYDEYLAEDPETAQDRRENLGELSTMFIKYQEEDEDFTLSDFLEDVSLISDIDAYNEDDDSVVLMTLHCAKGLEFPIVFICGMEENIFPSSQSIGDPEGLEEERRLAYVGITRAKEKLYLINADRRMLYGMTNRNSQSRFVTEIPDEVAERSGYYSMHSAYGSYFNDFDDDFEFDDFPQNKYQHQHSYEKPKIYEAPKKKKVIKKTYANHPVFVPGDRVKHKTFGEGIVLSSSPMGNDVLLEIAFDRVGTKKIMAYYAGLEKIDT